MMPHASLLSLAVLVLLVPTRSQEPGRANVAVSRYEMDVELSAEQRTVRGRQQITWRNTTQAPTDELFFHLYLNAFRDRDSTFMRESDEAFREQWRDDEFGGVEVESIELVSGAGAAPVALTQGFVSPDDDNTSDRTVARVALPRSVGPGESVTLRTRFTSRMPKAYRRTGWIPGGGFFCMHWFPKLGVLEERDGAAVWNCHQFHAYSEFFADFSEYRVTIDVPDGYVVGATGVETTSPEPLRPGRRIVTFAQSDPPVHDFAFVADPDFVVHTATHGPVVAADDEVAQRVAERMGVGVDTFDLPEVEIVLLLHPEHDSREQVDRHMNAVRCAIDFFGLRYGPYPYDTITVVDPGRDIQGRGLGGGMEYPMLITCGTSLYPHPRQPRPEGVTVHEFGHQYWYGLSANNEFEEAWLDEGLNTYSEGRAQWLHYHDSMRPVQTSEFGLTTLATVSAPFVEASPLDSLRALPLGLLPQTAEDAVDEFGFRATVIPRSPLLELLAAQPTATGFREASFEDSWNDRRRMLDVDNPDAMVRNGWEFLSRESYAANSYQRPATLLRTMERMVGRDTWWTFLRRFHQAARFAHPTTADFVAMLGSECGAGPAEFFRLAIQAGADFDYGVDSVSPRDGRGPRKTVVVRRYGGIRSDLRVRFRFEGRDAAVWRVVPKDRDDPWTAFSFTDDAAGNAYGRLLEVWVDPPGVTPGTGEKMEAATGPAGVYLIDSNLLNNAWRADPDLDPVLYRGIRALMQAQNRLMFSGIIG